MKAPEDFDERYLTTRATCRNICNNIFLRHLMYIHISKRAAKRTPAPPSRWGLKLLSDYCQIGCTQLQLLSALRKTTCSV